MLNKKVVVAGSLISCFVAQAGLNLNFSGVSDPTEIIDDVKIINTVTIGEHDDGNKTLRIHNTQQPGRVKIPTGMDDDSDFTLAFDWRNNGSAPGEVFRIGDWNHEKCMFRVNLEGGKFKAFTYNGKKFKQKRIFKPTKKVWYRLKFEKVDNQYTIEVVDLGKEHRTSGDVVYSSIEQKKRFKANDSVTPAQIFLGQWNGNGKNFYEYDNLVLRD